MARRSAGNPRYRKDATLGKTRRSAASAKPKREVGEAPVKMASQAGKGSSAGKGGRGGKVDWKAMEPSTPEFKQLRRVWFGLLMIAIVTSLAGYFLRKNETATTVSLILAYSSLFTAFGIDLLKIRPMRKAWQAELAGGGKKAKAEGAAAAKAEGSADTKKSSDEGKA